MGLFHTLSNSQTAQKTLIAAGVLGAAALINWGIPNLIARRAPRPTRIPKGTRLSFDDGPSQATEEVLNILRDEKIKAAFFVVGSRAEQRPDLIARMALEGHEIGMHAYEHKIWLSPWGRWTDMDRAHHALSEQGFIPRYYRAPHGFYDATALLFCLVHHIKPFHWHALVGDWEAVPAAKVVQRLRQAAGKGHVVVLHDGSAGTADPRAAERTPQVLEEFIALEKRDGRGFQTTCA